MRHCVLYEPFRGFDFMIFSDRQLVAAQEFLIDLERRGKRARFMTTTGTVTDVRVELSKLRPLFLTGAI